MATEVIDLTMPSLDEVRSAMPEGREPYSLLRDYFQAEGRMAKTRVARTVLSGLVALQESGNLHPPLPDKVFETVKRTAVCAAAKQCFMEHEIAVVESLMSGLYEHAYMPVEDHLG